MVESRPCWHATAFLVRVDLAVQSFDFELHQSETFQLQFVQPVLMDWLACNEKQYFQAFVVVLVCAEEDCQLANVLVRSDQHYHLTLTVPLLMRQGLLDKPHNYHIQQWNGQR
jgi:hypothetical protein